MATEITGNNEHTAVTRREAATLLQQDLRLSLGQTQSLPDMLMTAPFAINLLGQIKLLAFSDHALRICLSPPQGGFKYLLYPSLSSAIMQIVNEASKAFEVASKNMNSIRLQSTVMFGRNSHVQDILMCLQDPRVAKVRLRSSMTKFRVDMEKCSQLAHDIEVKFNVLVDSATEAYLAMSDETANTAREAEKLKENAMSVATEEKFQQTVLQDLETRVGDSRQEFEHARSTFQKEADRGEVSAFILGTMEDMKSTTLGLVNAVAGIFRDAPKATVAIACALGGVGGGGFETKVEPDEPAQPGPPAEPIQGIDPALLSAEQIESRVRELHELFKEDPRDVEAMIDDGGVEIVSCHRRLEAIKNSIGDYQSKYAHSARDILDEAINLCISVLDFDNSHGSKRRTSNEWRKVTERWRKATSSPVARAVKLRSAATSQPGCGFGSSLYTTSGLGQIDAKDSGTTKVLKNRHEKLLITRAAMKDAQDIFERNRDAQLAAQEKMMKLANEMQNLQYRQATVEETRTILLKSIQAMADMQDQLRQLAGFFHSLAEIICTVGMDHAKRYLDTVEAGISEQGCDVFTLAYSDMQRQTIRETMILLRGHFGFVVKSADLYREVAASHINPCIRLAATLPLGASLEVQEEAKQKLALLTNGSAEAIRLLAERELEAYHKELEGRCIEIEAEIGTLPALADEAEVLKAIKEGVEESKEEMAKNIAERVELFEELSDDLY